ncbi:mannitol dehydrogenase family protein [Butyrivibrio sp. WCD2001]|uniref:mannitol dehydrogenase family protein n=1 Tax=Butyrivibrio sp. WCD2001 TaxID=1280681 RepID=UPI0003F50AC3|nr:mannitol dehydrogenase family protein [Butyrivibrio sp. WCD2001]
MKLNSSSIKSDTTWKEKGYILPTFDRDKMIEETKATPQWVHFGAGNIFRAFQANLAQRMLEEGHATKGLTVVEGFDYEIIEKMYRPHDNLSILVTLKADGSVEKTVVESIAESCILDSENEKEFERLKEIFRADSLQLTTFTITEKGYCLTNPAGELLPAVAADFENGPEKPASYIGKVAALLYERFLSGKKPIAMVSTDNCSHNGDKLFEAISAFAENWVKNGKADKDFLSYIKDESMVSFPWSMIDKITPRPDDSVNEILKNDGVEELEAVVTSKNTWVAPFVNAEESEYLVIEDKFPNGRPALEKVGVIFTTKETVDKVERMKVCTCLNPLHTSLAVFGCVLGYDKISEEMKDEDLVALVKKVGYVEGLPVVTDPGVIKPQEFIDTVVNVRIPNKFMPDTPQRIACDTSQKLPIRFGETIKAYAASDTLDVMDLKCIPLVFAGWLRYLMGVTDDGKTFEPSPDPLLTKCQEYVKDIRLGEKLSADELKAKVLPLLKDEKIFGVDLEQTGLADRVTDYFAAMIEGEGAVRETLKDVVCL